MSLKKSLRSFGAYVLPAVVFMTGACVLVVEVAAVRVLAPYFGSTLFTVSSVLGVVLGALSLGYFFGGRLADRKPKVSYFYWLIAVSGLAVVASGLLAEILLPLFGYMLPLSVGPLLASIFLFLVPSALLGTLSPFAVVLQQSFRPEVGVGKVSGTIFFWSTLGSISGSLLAGFALIPYFGVRSVIFLVGVVLILLGLCGLVVYRSPWPTVGRIVGIAVLLVLVWFRFDSLLTRQNYVYRQDGVYERLTVVDGTYKSRPTRFFYQDLSSSGAMHLDTGTTAYNYSHFYEAYKAFSPQADRALVLGGGAYLIPKAILAEFPASSTVDVVEIEPTLYDLAQKYFGLETDSRLHNHVTDGRRFLADSPGGYDLIFSDVYHSLYSVPSHFTTQEFYRLAESRLAPEGVFMANIIGDMSDDSLSLALSSMRTFRTVFPNSYFFAVESPEQEDAQNIIFVGYKSDRVVDFSNHAVPFVRGLSARLIDPDRFDYGKQIVLTDDFAPTDRMVAAMLRRLK
ncbi:MAG TPA: fused MFS/spermidine synthase [Candidatus Paceibacterota bacterium]|nr:fused MFS/spermidine synthase [Candidatus Paceibacterota bacterium]